MDEITNHLVVAYQAVKGELDQYYGPDDEMTVLLRKLMIVEPVTILKRRD